MAATRLWHDITAHARTMAFCSHRLSLRNQNFFQLAAIRREAVIAAPTFHLLARLAAFGALNWRRTPQEPPSL
jgi:hypothetical protein